MAHLGKLEKVNSFPLGLYGWSSKHSAQPHLPPSSQIPSRKPTHLYTHFKINMHKSRIQAEGGGWEGPLRFFSWWTLPQNCSVPPGEPSWTGSNCSIFEKFENSFEYHTCFVIPYSTQTQFWGLQHKFSPPKNIYKFLNSAQRVKKPKFLLKFVGNPPTQDPTPPPNFTKGFFFSLRRQKTKTALCKFILVHCPNPVSDWPHRWQRWKMPVWVLEGWGWVGCPFDTLWTLRCTWGQEKQWALKASKSLANGQRKWRIILSTAAKESVYGHVTWRLNVDASLSSIFHSGPYKMAKVLIVTFMRLKVIVMAIVIVMAQVIVILVRMPRAGSCP